MTATAPLPVGFTVALDVATRQLRPRVWWGGAPARVLRLTDSGALAWDELRAGPVTSARAGVLARRLTDAGLAHPRPPAAPAGDITVLVPAHDRPQELARCLAALGDAHPVVVVDDASADPAAVAHVAGRFGATLVCRRSNGGPGAARNTGLEHVRSEFVAFVDSDCVPPPGWLDTLSAHLADPLVAAVAPRIVGRGGTGWAGRYTTARSCLDLGAAPGRVMPNSRVSYVPTAALLARTAALRDVARGGYVFDPAKRVGEDVDLVWRLHRAGWRVRYDPSATVDHQEPRTWRELLGRRFRYGTSAAPLTRSHPEAGAPLVVHPWPAFVAAAVLARRPALAAAGFGGAVASTVRLLRRSDIPTRGVVRTTASAVRQTLLGSGRYATQFAAPLLLAGAARRRPEALVLLLAPAVTAWFGHRRELDPGRFVLAHLADEIAYGAGVWFGCITHRTTAPVRPRIVRRPFSR